MGDARGFLKHERRVGGSRPREERLRDYREVERGLPLIEQQQQASRCMACGVPFCHSGCPLGNVIPEFNELVHRGLWEEASAALHATNNFPEFTGRVCPAPCEAACVLNIEGAPVTIEELERSIADRAWAQGWVRPERPARRSGRSVAVVGSGPAGLACAQELRRKGHDVVVFERADRVGGLLRYGIPDFKLEKHQIDRRIEQLAGEGVLFKTGVEVGVDVSVDDLLSTHDAIVLAIGAAMPRDLPLPGRSLEGIHFAMDFLVPQNRRVAGDEVRGDVRATDRRVVVLGGGDTGSDCVGTALRQGAKEVISVELLPQPPVTRSSATPWPEWPMVLRSSSSHDEGGQRVWSIRTERFVGADGQLEALEAVNLEDGSPLSIEADLCLLALGFTGPEPPLLAALGLERDERGAIATADQGFSVGREGVFACGDARRGQSLVVWAIREGREVAAAVDGYLNASEGALEAPRAAISAG